MEKIQLFRVSKINMRFLIGFGLLAFVFGISLLINTLMNGFDFVFPGDWNSVLFISQGILFLIWGYQQSQKRKYFIEWNNNELSYLLPKQKSIELIPISDVRQLEIKGNTIHIQGIDSERNFRLEHVEWQELKKVKALFEDISLKSQSN